MKTMLRLLITAACLWLLSTVALADTPPKDMRVYILDTGWLECDANWMVAMSVVGTRGHPHPTARWIKIPVYDSLSFFTSIEKVRSLAKKHDAQVMFPHDMKFFKTLKTAPRYYD